MELSSFTFSSRRFAAGAALLLFFLTLEASVLGRAMDWLDWNHLIVRSLDAGLESGEECEVLFLGDSRCQQGLDPDAFEGRYRQLTGRPIRAYNLGRPGMQAPMEYLVLRDYLTRTSRPPQAIVVNFSFYLLGDARWLRDVYMNYYTPSLVEVADLSEHGIITPREAACWCVQSRIPFLRYRARAKGLVELAALDPARLRGELVAIWRTRPLLLDPTNRGFLSRGCRHIGPADLRDENYEVGMESRAFLDYVGEIFELAANYRVHVFVYEYPWPTQRKSPQFDDLLRYYDALVRERGDGNPYVHFVERECYWPLDFFVNSLHLNQPGAERLSQEAAGWVADLRPDSTLAGRSGVALDIDSQPRWDGTFSKP